MNHAIGYLGPYEPNIAHIYENLATYVKRDDDKLGEVDRRPEGLNGIFFGYLEKLRREFFAIRVSYRGTTVNVQNPVRLNPERHTDGKKFGPQPSQFGDTSAANLLQDMIAENPSEADCLNSIGRKCGLL